MQAQKYIQSLPFMPQQDLEKIFRGANPLGGFWSTYWVTNFWNSIEKLWEAAMAPVVSLKNSYEFGPLDLNFFLYSSTV